MFILQLNRNFLVFFLLGISFSFLLFNSCETKKTTFSNVENIVLDYSIDTANIPKDTINFSNPSTTLLNGLYYFNEKLYSGILYKELKGFKIKTYSSILNGRLHGEYRSFYENGSLYEIRNYKNNASLGKQLGYWENSKILKFEYNYYNDKKEGTQRNWYANGKLASVYNYKNDKQDGLQQAWRANGSLYRNFEVKNGRRYGLQKSKLCYELEDEVLQN